MAVTRSFKTMVEEPLASDPGFRESLLRESAETMLASDMETGKAVLRDYIKATIGRQERKGSDRTDRSCRIGNA